MNFNVFILNYIQNINYPIVIKRLYVDKILDQIIWSGIPTSVILNKKNEVLLNGTGRIIVNND